MIDRETAWPSLPRRARLLFGLAGIERLPEAEEALGAFLGYGRLRR